MRAALVVVALVATGCPAPTAIPCNVDDDCPAADLCFQGLCTAAERVPHDDAGPGGGGEGEGSGEGEGEGEGVVGEGEGEGVVGEGEGEGEGAVGEGEGAAGEGEGVAGEGEGVAGEGEGEGPAALIAAWSFDGIASGGFSVHDDSGNGHDLALSTTKTLTAGIEGNALVLDVGQHGTAANLTVDALGASSFTVALCFTENTSLDEFDMPFYFGGASVGDPGIDLETGFNGWDFSLNDGSNHAGVDVGDVSLDGTGFHCFAAAVDRGRGELRGYRDGMLVDTGDISQLAPFASATRDFFIGGDSGGSHPLDGAIDDVQIVASALNDADVGALHDPLIAPGLLARWSFDSLGQTGDVAFDVSGHGHDGVVQSAFPQAGVLLQGIDFVGGFPPPLVSDFNLTAADFTTSSFTVSLCYRSTIQAEPTETLLQAGGSCTPTSQGVCVQHDDVNGITAILGDGGVHNCTLAEGSSTSNTYHCATVVADRAALLCTEYIDGAVADTDSMGGGLGSLGNGALVFGSVDGSSQPHGGLDEVRIYTRALSASEVAALPHP